MNIFYLFSLPTRVMGEGDQPDGTIITRCNKCIQKVNCAKCIQYTTYMYSLCACYNSELCAIKFLPFLLAGAERVRRCEMVTSAKCIYL